MVSFCLGRLSTLTTVAIFTALIVANAASAVPIYSITDLGQVSPSFNFSRAFGINDARQVVGIAGAGTGQSGFLWDPTTQIMTDLGDFPGGDDFSQASGVNNAGIVVGVGNPGLTSPNDLQTINRAFRAVPPTQALEDIGDLPGGAEDSNAMAVNNSGQIVGYSNAATGSRAFLWDPTTQTMKNLGDLPGGQDESLAFGINDLGQVVGVSGNATTESAFIWNPVTQTMTDLGTLPGGDDNSQAKAINNVGQVVGNATGPSGSRAVIWDLNTQTIIDLGDLPGGSGPEAIDINDSGQVVGFGSTAFGVRPFLWEGGTMYDLSNLLDPNDPLFGLITLEDARAINVFGDIAVNGFFNGTGQIQAFLLTRQPGRTSVAEPSTLLTLAVGLSLLSIRRRAIAKSSLRYS